MYSTRHELLGKLTIKIDHGMIILVGGDLVQEVAISEFKAKCLAMLEQVRKTKKPLRVTRFGKPVADILPPAPPATGGEWIGSMRGTMRIVGDIVSPVMSDEDWEAFRD